MGKIIRVHYRGIPIIVRVTDVITTRFGTEVYSSDEDLYGALEKVEMDTLNEVISSMESSLESLKEFRNERENTVVGKSLREVLEYLEEKGIETENIPHYLEPYHAVETILGAVREHDITIKWLQEASEEEVLRVMDEETHKKVLKAVDRLDFFVNI